MLSYVKFVSLNADVAKLDKASGYEPEDSRFKSWHLYYKRSGYGIWSDFFVFI